MRPAAPTKKYLAQVLSLALFGFSKIMVVLSSNKLFLSLINTFNAKQCFCFGVFLLVASTIASHAQAPLQKLESGNVVTMTLSGGETHSYQLSLLAGQFVQVRVEQIGIDVELKLLTENGQPIMDTDALNSTQGPEVFAVISNTNANFRLAINSPGKGLPAGKYEIQIVALRPATENDQLWVTAQKFYLDGKQLRDKPSSDSQLQAIKKFAEALRIWQVMDDRLMVSHALYYLASGYRRVGQTQHALVYSSYALELVRSIKEEREEVTALMALAIVLSELGESRKARDYFEQALGQWRKFDDAFGEAQTLSNLGQANSQLGETALALRNYENALVIWKKLGDRFQQADTLSKIGLAYDNLGAWQKSLENATQAHAIYRAIENKRGEATTLNNIGLVYSRIGEARKAIDYYTQSIVLWRILGNRREEATALSNLGFAQTELYNSQAMTSYQLSLQLWRETGDRRGEALVLQRIGELQASLNEAQAALDYFNQALPLIRTSGDSNREATLLISIAALHLSQKEPAKAKEVLQQAKGILQSLGNRAGEAQALYLFARAETDLGNLGQARLLIASALDKAEAVRVDAGSPQSRASYLASVHKYYELNLDILMRLHQTNLRDGFDALAVQASERARARSLLELLSEARANIREGVDNALLERADKISQQLSAAAQRQLRLTSQRGNDASLQELKREISKLEDEYNQVEAAIRKSSPHYAALTQPQPLSLPEIQQQLDDDSLLLEYSLGEEQSWLWAVTKNSIASFALPKRAEIDQAAIQTRDLLIVRGQLQRGESARQREVRLSQAETQFPVAAGTLSQMLLSPVADLLANRKLIIVPDGALQYVPFAALPTPLGGEEFGVSGFGFRGKKTDPQNAKRDTLSPKPETRNLQPLIVAHEIITLPSVSTLAVMRAENASRKPAPKSVAVFADPVFSGDEARSRSKIIKTKSESVGSQIAKARGIVQEDEKSSQQLKLGELAISQLPFTRLEAEQILALDTKADNFKATGFAATRAAALNPALSQYRYVHFATHGLIDNERPGLSALVLSLADESGKPQNGFLRATDIYNLKLPAELVVLSACQTGLGKDVKGEGLIGLTRGFMYAGAARVVVSLWNVNDKATAELMTQFYEKMLKEGERPAAALRSAQIAMWQQKQWQAPYYWAAFTLQGEWK